MHGLNDRVSQRRNGKNSTEIVLNSLILLPISARTLPALERLYLLTKSSRGECTRAVVYGYRNSYRVYSEDKKCGKTMFMYGTRRKSVKCH